MKPKEKAIELVKRYLLKIKIDTKTTGESEVIISKGEIRIETAKHCALIAVDEILDAICFNMCDEDEWNKENEYWEEVKQEIEKL